MIGVLVLFLAIYTLGVVVLTFFAVVGAGVDIRAGYGHEHAREESLILLGWAWLWPYRWLRFMCVELPLILWSGAKVLVKRP